MPKVALITDTDSSLPPELAAAYAIQQVPIAIHFGAETFHAGVDMDDARCFERIDREGRLPSTSAASPGDFLKAFRVAFEAGADEVLCITVSSQVSAVYASALSAREELPDRKIAVLDSQSLSMGQGFMTLAAAVSLAGGADVTTAVQRALEVRRRSHLFVALSTLKYLAMSGRVGQMAAAFGGLLDIRPILTVKEGKLDLLERARTQKKSWQRIVELCCESIQRRPLERLALLHVNALPEARQLQFLLKSALQEQGLVMPAEIVEAALTPGLSVHAGAGAVGFVVVEAL